MTEPFKLFRRTTSYQQRLQLVSREAIRLARRVEAHDRFRGTRTIQPRRFGGSVIAVDGRPWAGWASITGAPTGSAYPWQEQYAVGSTLGNQTEGRSGTASVNPAREVNGNTAVPTGAKVLVWIDDDHEGYRFFYPPGTGGVLERTAPSQITSNQNDFNPSSTANFWVLTSDAPRTITGIGDPANGRTILVTNNGSYPIYFTHEDTNSTATNRVKTPTETTFVLPPCHGVWLTYGKDSTTKRWNVIGPTYPYYYPLAPSQITTSVNNYDLDVATSVRVTSDAERTITGIGTPWPDRRIILRNTGSFNIILTDEDTNSDAANRFALPNNQSLTLRPDDSVTMVYDDTTARWRVDAETTRSGFVTPTWLKFTKSYTDYNDTAGTTKSVTFYTLPIKGVLHKIVIKTGTAWAGTGITSVAGDVTVDGNNAVSAYDLDAAVADNNFASLEDSGGGATPYTGLDFINFGGTRAVALAVTSGGANLDQLTAGVVDIWLLVSVLP